MKNVKVEAENEKDEYLFGRLTPVEPTESEFDHDKFIKDVREKLKDKLKTSLSLRNLIQTIEDVGAKNEISRDDLQMIETNAKDALNEVSTNPLNKRLINMMFTSLDSHYKNV
jgi:hypothetical protein